MKKISLLISTFLIICPVNIALAIDCNDNTDCAEGFECVTGICVVIPEPTPEITLRQGVTNIVDGGSYNYGNTNIGTDTDILFTIENIGTANLDLTTPLTINGVDANQYSIQTQPTSPLTTSSTTTFTVRFNPSSTGIKAASIAIANNDIDENPFDLMLNGTGTSPTTGNTFSWMMFMPVFTRENIK